MAMKNYRVRHIRSSVVENDLPKLPTAAQLEFGEIAINYAAGHETLSIKNNSGDVVTFSPAYKVDDFKAEVIKTEKVISSSLNDLNDRVIALEEGGNIQELSGSVITLSGSVEETEESIAYALIDLDTKMTGVSGDVTTFVKATKLELEDINDRVIALEEGGNVQELSGSVITLSGSVSAEIERAISAETIVSGNVITLAKSTNFELERINTDIDALSGNVTTISGNVTTLSGDVVSLGEDVITISGNVTTLANASELELTRLDSGMTAISGVVATLNSHQVSGTSAITVTESNNKSTVELVINSNDKVLTQDALGLLSNISLDIANDGKTVYLKGKNNQTISSINTSAFVIDGMLDNVVLSGDTLVFTFNTDAGKQEIDVPLSGFIDIYTVSAGSENYLEISDYKIGAKVDVTNGLASKNSVDNLASSAATSANTLNTKINTEVANAIASAATSADTLNSIIREDEEITAAAFVSVNESISAITSGITELSAIVDENEEITAAALTDINTRISNIVNELTSIKNRLTQIENS